MNANISIHLLSVEGMEYLLSLGESWHAACLSRRAGMRFDLTRARIARVHEEGDSMQVSCHPTA